MLSDPFVFQVFKQEDIKDILAPREGEKKLGESVHFGNSLPQTKYLILGIEESMGPMSNLGLKGSERAYKCFLQRFLNMQANRYIDGSEICILGSIEQKIPFSSIAEGRKNIETLDKLVTEVLLANCNDKVIPIIIGGGHNNAFPLIHYSYSAAGRPIQVINLDPHADCRPLEGRHSGNPFSYAFALGLVTSYAVIGLHQAYNSEYLLNYLQEKNCFYRFFEDYIDHPERFDADLKELFGSLKNEIPVGIELDMDVIQHMPSSAFSPSGITLEQARRYIRIFAKHPSSMYLHLPEAAPQNLEDEKIVGKSLAYLVWDFIQTRQQYSSRI